MQLDGYRGFTHGLERLNQLDLAAVDFEALGLELMRNVGGGDGTEEVAVLARLAGEAEHQRLKLRSQRLGQCLLRSGAANSGGLHLFNDSLVGGGSLQCQLTRQQEIATVA